MKQTRRGRGVGYTLAHSLYITKSWNWFLELMGRAAEAVLVISVLYASVKLLPVVHMPAGLDVVIFIAQFVALDVGGLSLGKLAKQAQNEGNTEGASQASRMSKALITVMIVGVVVVAIEQLFPIPADWKLGIDTALLIARSILAVLYGHIIHTLRKEDLFTDEELLQPEGAQISWSLVGMAAHLQREYQQLASDQEQRLHEMQTRFEQRLVDERNQMLSSLQQLQQSSTVDFEAITRQVEAANEARFEALAQTMMRQQVTITEAREARQIEAPKKPREAKPPASNIVTLRQAGTPATDKRAMVYALLDKGDQRSSYLLAPVVGCSAATVQRYMKDWRTEHGEATGTEE